jgi:hypothetical protein
MPIWVEAIKFNHDQTSLSHDALNIRKNASTLVSVPEWIRGISVNPENSLAAYSIEETRGNTITIQVRFSCTDPAIRTMEVRAVDPVWERYRSGYGCLYWILTRLGVKFFMHPLELANVLGEVKAREVEFRSDGFTNFETFELERERIGKKGVNIHAIEWQWQYRLSPTDAWQDLVLSRHRIYIILEIPKLPWVQIPQNAPNVPWTDVLDYACRWASWTSTIDGAASKMTGSIYDLGPEVMEYDCPGGGSSNYSWPVFDCTAFVELLRGGIGLGRYVNCSDCATILSTFANILGCDLWQSRMYSARSFELNPIKAIGSDVWQPACGWGGFSYHEVAWKGACTSNDNIFDACLAVDGDSDPTAAPHQFLLPVNMRFGNAGDGDYRDRLATPVGRPNCEAQPSSRQRRDVT